MWRAFSTSPRLWAQKAVFPVLVKLAHGAFGVGQLAHFLGLSQIAIPQMALKPKKFLVSRCVIICEPPPQC